ncbi:sensor histidine kinase [Cryptosporangium aurantiacum]|uniref:histidine kinase n=1 Tax=Cryptosporangium aurantiacum TaxID=134849 RepID=A0A1M7NF28_9ACTN|nr:HAMP domain-containing sensor histidine kinase [Cryptosporangium aurantiacum]SHN01991.1 Signal transduction histidine kinase [Cryptosporangium aurantiacum]
MNRLTLRVRLALVYGGLFMFSGVVLLAVTYVLVAQRLPADGGTRPLVKSGVPGQGESVITDVRMDAQNEALTALLTQGGVALLLVGIAATAFGWLIAGRMLHPLQRVTETARRIADAPIADRSLHERIALEGPHDEVKELADTFDVMLERLDHAFDGERRFIANASHELRTPLTVNRALLEVALHRSDPVPEVRHLAETLLAVNGRHERLIDGLLLLARSERDVGERAFLDLADLADHVAGSVSPGSVTVLTKLAEAPTTGNPVLLERLVQNLVENGLRYNLPSHGSIEIATGVAQGSAVLEVRNTGPVVPRYEVPGLFQPFRRLSERVAGSSGAGLGLSIVQAVARAHGGSVSAVPGVEGGLVVTVRLPGAA